MPHIAQAVLPWAGGGPSSTDDRHDATSPIVRGSPLPTLYGRTSPGGHPSPAAARTAATFAAATSRTWTKSRRCRPSSKTRGGSPRRTADRNTAATPAYGVSRGIRGPYTLW